MRRRTTPEVAAVDITWVNWSFMGEALLGLAYVAYTLGAW